MLVKGQIPENEPIVSIGLVLPVDEQKSIEIEFGETKEKIQIRANEKNLFLNRNPEENIYLTDSSFTLNPIRAGRGFHWEKQISITVEGELEIKIVYGYLFVINHISLEKYLICVATSEMSGECPQALLESQTVAARSWLLAAAEQKHADLGLDACNDDCCQRYQGMGNLTDAAIAASEKTRGRILIYDGKICDTRYSKSCGGISENNENAWGGEPKPYLRAIRDGNNSTIPKLKSESDLNKWLTDDQHCFCGPDYVPENQLERYLGNVDKSGSYFRWNVSFTQEELTILINEKTGKRFESIQSLQPLERGISGRIIQLRIDGKINGEPSDLILENEYEIRWALHPDFLYSSAFIIEANSTADSLPSRFTFKGAGWGHGVGLCQIGALGMSLNGTSFTDILSHYFQSTELRKIYD